MLQGEMGATIFFYPDEWRVVKQEVLSRLTAADPQLPALDPGQVFFGVAVNNNKLCGCIGIGIVDAYQYLAAFPESFAAVESGAPAGLVVAPFFFQGRWAALHAGVRALHWVLTGCQQIGARSRGARAVWAVQWSGRRACRGTSSWKLAPICMHGRPRVAPTITAAGPHPTQSLICLPSGSFSLTLTLLVCLPAGRGRGVRFWAGGKG